MKTIGLIGGISWVSTADYYRYLNEGVNRQLGGLNFAQCLIYSFNYADIKKNNDSNNWYKTLDMLLKACRKMEAAGADAILLCANTMHKVADQLQQSINIPLIHIAKVTAQVIANQKLNKVALLGTKFTMEEDFFTSKLAAQGIESLIPGEEDREFIHRTIGDELGKGILTAETRQRYLDIIEALIARGAEGIILGCTEIPLLIKQADVPVPVFDTTFIHANEAVNFALEDYTWDE